MRTGVVGFGIAAQVMHLPFIVTNPHFQLTTILQRKGDEAKTKYPSVKVVRSIEEMLADPELELVVITTPNDTHFDYAARSLQAGKNVVLEKPFTITSADALKLVNIAKDSGRTLSVFQNRRYVSDFLTIKQLLSSNVLGKIAEFEAHYHRYRPEQRPNAWRERNEPGSGILYDLGAHLIDQACVLFGLPKAVTADVRNQRPHAITTDYFELWLDYGFTKVILKSGMLVREPGPRYMIFGTLGSFLKSGEDPQEALLRAGRMPESPDWGKEKEAYYGSIYTTLHDQEVHEIYPSLKGNYAGYYEDFYQSVKSGTPPPIKPEHGYNTIRIIETAIQSNAEKRTVACTGLIDIGY